MPTRKLILVIGGTGAQGAAVIHALLKPAPDGSPSPFAIRVLTRDPSSRRAQELASKGHVELHKGSFTDLSAVEEALKGAYGAFVNTDSFTVTSQEELFLGIRIFELAKQVGTLKHYVWSDLDYVLKISGYNPLYSVDHHNTKGRVGEWISVQESDPSSMIWSRLTTGPYMDMLYLIMFGPIKARPDGTFVFASPVGQGHVPMVALADIGTFARYIFDNPSKTSEQNLKCISECVAWPDLVKTFTTVTGKPAEYVPLTVDEWMGLWNGTESPLAGAYKNVADPAAQGLKTWSQNFTAWWSMWRDDVLQFDMDEMRKINPHQHTLESWMREVKYDGQKSQLLKNTDNGSFIKPNVEAIGRL